MRNGERIALDIAERQELLERSINHHTNRFLDAYSPVRISIKTFKKHRLQKAQNIFYGIIGQIALTHAGIEQDLKNTLIVDWGVPEKFEYGRKTYNLEHLHGRDLRVLFIKLIEDMLIPEDYFKRYKSLRDAFWELSKKRNNALKAIYAFNQDTAAISQIHEKEHAKHNSKRSYEEIINAWMPSVDLAELANLLSELQALRGKFVALRAEIFRDKIRLTAELCSEIGKTYPAYAFKNPYLYQHELL